MVAPLRPSHVRADLRAFTGGAYYNRLKVWRKLREHALATDMTEIDFTSGIKNLPTNSDGFHTWTPDETERFRDFWPVGTPQRLAFELIYWTGAQCLDARRLGRQMVEADGWLRYTHQKTDGEVEVPLTTLPPSMPEMAADHAQLMACLRGHTVWFSS